MGRVFTNAQTDSVLKKIYEPRREKTCIRGSRPGQIQTGPAGCPDTEDVARGLKFRIYEVEGLNYLCSENKVAEQMRSNLLHS